MSAERPVKEREDAALFYDRLILLYQSLKVLPNNYTKILRLLQLVLGLNLGLKNIYTSYHCEYFWCFENLGVLLITDHCGLSDRTDGARYRSPQ